LKIDEDTLQDVVNLGYGKDHVCESLRNRLQNEATVAYYLLLDNRFRATSGYLGADYQESLERNFNRFASSESASSNTRHYLPGSSDPHASGLRPHYPVERKWALGLQVLHDVPFYFFCNTPKFVLTYQLSNSHELNLAR
jgi:5'-AMP-activated protein kinase catalytic alpha subunit